jgi:hypothetical protein
MATPEKDVPKTEWIFWSPAAKMEVGGYEPEVKADSGAIKKPDRGIQFYDHICVLNVERDKQAKKKADYIMSCGSFVNGQIVLCPTIEAAQAHTETHLAHRAGIVRHTTELSQVEDKSEAAKHDIEKV